VKPPFESADLPSIATPASSAATSSTAEAAIDSRLHHTVCGTGSIVWRHWPASADGPSQKGPVVLLHGGSGSWTHWLRNIAALRAQGRDVWAPDLPGFGDSAASPGGSDADALVAPLATGLKALFAGRAIDLVGFSFGGLTAGLLLAAHPQLARRLVLVGAPAMGVVPGRQFELRAWRHLADTAAQEAAHRHNLGALMLHDPAAIEGLALELHVANVMRDRAPRRRLAHTNALARALPLVRCPIHAIYGAHDALYRQWITALEQAYADAAPHFFRGLTLIENAGHWVQFEQPGAFDVALRKVLGTARSNTGH
jgi:2-hydroxy-6-oxonona-2,4-dienedioate hydrolase